MKSQSRSVQIRLVAAYFQDCDTSRLSNYGVSFFRSSNRLVRDFLAQLVVELFLKIQSSVMF